MENVIAGLIARYGSPVTLRNASDSCTVTAMLQPLRQQGGRSAYRHWTTLGEQGPGRYLLLCSVCPEGYDQAEHGGSTYWLRRWEPYEVGGNVLYYCAVLTKEE